MSDKVKLYIQKHLSTIPAAIKKELSIPSSLEYLYEAQGCQLCNFKGYKGRTGLYEVMPMTEEISQIIMKNPVESLIFKAAQKEGMLTMAQEGALKVLAGETTIDEIERATTAEY